MRPVLDAVAQYVDGAGRIVRAERVRVARHGRQSLGVSG